MTLLSAKFLSCFLFVFSCAKSFSSEENFLLINGISGEQIIKLGPHIKERITPCSTFKIALSLMGFNADILKDEKTPIWLFQDGNDDWLESWKSPQTPQSWIKSSCIWYSKELAIQLGLKNIQSYLAILKYGNQDMSGGVTKAWLGSSLKISVKEQVELLQTMLQGKFSIASHAIQMTKALLFIEELPKGWKLFGKTGWSGSIIGADGKNVEIGWFVGWVEKDHRFFPFAYNIREEKNIKLAQRIPTVKKLLMDSNIILSYIPSPKS